MGTEAEKRNSVPKSSLEILDGYRTWKGSLGGVESIYA